MREEYRQKAYDSADDRSHADGSGVYLVFVEFSRLYDRGNHLFYLSFLRIFYLNDLSADGHRCDGSKKEMQRPDLVEGLPAGSICDNIFFLCDIFAYESYTNEYVEKEIKRIVKKRGQQKFISFLL